MKSDPVGRTAIFNEVFDRDRRGKSELRKAFRIRCSTYVTREGCAFHQPVKNVITGWPNGGATVN